MRAVLARLLTAAWLASHTGCSAPSRTPSDGADALVANDALWIDGEYCPSPQFPPKSDGCPCMPSLSPPYTPFTCTEATLGQICEYFNECPDGLVRRYRCQWTQPKEADRYLSYVGITSRFCDMPTNDGG